MSAVDLDLSVVVLAWNNLPHTKRFVDSVRTHTDVPYELVIVDNGSEPEAAAFAADAADEAVMNRENLGFAKGMNQGLAAASGEFVAFCNNDTVLPQQWASRLLETARKHSRAAIVVPAITTASNPATVRSQPGEQVVVLDPFSAPPPAVIYVMRRSLVHDLGGWEEEYEIASGEDVDLCFKVWVNDCDIVFDERVLVEHVGHATGAKLGDSRALWARNRRRFLAKWRGSTDPPQLGTCDPERFARNRATARAVAGWMDQYFTLRDKRAAAPPAGTPRTFARRAWGKLRRI